MNSRVTRQFRAAFARLPPEVQQRARQVFRLWLRDPRHPSLHFKRAHPTLHVYSVRVGVHWRALGLMEEGTLVWFWIGSHADYDGVLSRM